jgi:GAF domain-containing protein
MYHRVTITTRTSSKGRRPGAKVVNAGVIGGLVPRETLLARTLVELADTLVADFDVVELLTRLADGCVEVLDVGAAGLMLAGPDGELRVMASSSEAMRMLELFELQAKEGPCLDCYHSGAPVLEADLAVAGTRWPHFAPEALAVGFRSVQALPMRLRGTVIGALNLFGADPGEMQRVDMESAQALADVATIAILQQRKSYQAQTVNQQLHHALNSRVVIEQAKGMVAERERLNMQAAFGALRSYARNHNLRLVDVARSVVDGSLGPSELSLSPEHGTGQNQIPT